MLRLKPLVCRHEPPPQIIEFVREEDASVSDCSVREHGTGMNAAVYFTCTKQGSHRTVLCDRQTLTTIGWGWAEGPVAAYIVDALNGGGISL